MVVMNGEFQVAQYGQWDGYPEGQGVTILEFLRSADLAAFANKIRTDVSFITEAQWKKIIDEHTDNGSVTYGSEHDRYWKEHLSHLDRDIGGEILQRILETDGPILLRDSLSFAGDSLFCEWAYLVDLDNMKLEVYEGFNKEPVTEGRFKTGDENLESSGNGESHPIRLIKTFDLDALPTRDEFVAEVTAASRYPDEDDEE